jgi:hypothetical protein
MELRRLRTKVTDATASPGLWLRRIRVCVI